MKPHKKKSELQNPAQFPTLSAKGGSFWGDFSKDEEGGLKSSFDCSSWSSTKDREDISVGNTTAGCVISHLEHPPGTGQGNNKMQLEVGKRRGKRRSKESQKENREELQGPAPSGPCCQGSIQAGTTNWLGLPHGM